MDDKDIETLAAIMAKRHGQAAASIARKRALRCKHMRENDWAKTWNAVADRIAVNANKPEAAAD